MRWMILGFLISLPLMAQDKPVLGIDMYGDERACHPMGPDEEICSAQFTEGDQYAADCIAQGGEAVACGCHDFLCILITP